MLPFFQMFPEIAEAETRTLVLSHAEDAEDPAVPPDEYAFVEVYCVKPDCDCRRVILNVFGWNQDRHLATISHAFSPFRPTEWVREQTFLDPLNPQCEFSEDLLDLFESVVLTPDYAARLERHYRMVKQALKDPRHPIHDRIPPEPGINRSKRPNPADLLVPRRRGAKMGKKSWR